jgi:hypothetical protein
LSCVYRLAQELRPSGLDLHRTSRSCPRALPGVLESMEDSG